MVYEIVVENNKVVKCVGEDEEWGSTSGLKLVNYVKNFFEEEGLWGLDHLILDNIQMYYNFANEHCCWSFEELSEEPDEDINYAKITIDGETRYYEEW